MEALLESVANHLELLHSDLPPSEYDDAIGPLINTFISLPSVRGFLPLNHSPPLPDSSSQLAKRIQALENSFALLKPVEVPKGPATPDTSHPLDPTRPAPQPSISPAEKSPRPTLPATPAGPSVVVSLGAITCSDDRRPQPVDICTKINDLLASASYSQLRVSSVQWTQQGDLVIIGGPHTTAHELSVAQSHITEVVRAFISSISPQPLINPPFIGANHKSPHSARREPVATPMIVDDEIPSILPTSPEPDSRREEDNPKGLDGIGDMSNEGTVGDFSKQCNGQPLPGRKRIFSSLYPDGAVEAERMEKRARVSDADPTDSRSEQQRSQAAPTSEPTSGGWNRREGVELEGLENIVEAPDVDAVASEQQRGQAAPTPEPTSGGWNRSGGIELDGMDNIVEVPGVGAVISSGSLPAQNPAPTLGAQTPGENAGSTGTRQYG